MYPPSESKQARKTAVLTAATRRISSQVAAALQRYNSQLPHAPSRLQALERLADGNCAAIVSGQQVGLYLSPTLVLLKAAGAIRTARALEAETGVGCIPVFWLQSEDHDFEEIRTARFLDPSGELRDVSLTPRENRCSVQYQQLGEEITTCNQQLAENIGRLPYSDQVLQTVDVHYRPENNIVDAFAALLAEYTAEYGLLFLNPRADGFGAALQQGFQTAFSQRSKIEKLLTEAGQQLLDAGEEPQVHVRDNSPLFFFHAESASSARFRLHEKPESDEFELLGGNSSISTKELTELLATAPERFSSSALLRPLLQDLLLPTAAYLAGPSEQQYFQQLAPLYNVFELPHPLLLSRPQCRFLEPKTQSLLGELKLQPRQLQNSREELLSILANLNDGNWPKPQDLRQTMEDQLLPIWNTFAPAVENLDPTLQGPFDKTRNNVENSFEKFLERYEKAAVRQDEVMLARLDRLLARMLPEGNEQDRSLSALYYLAGYGNDLLPKLLSVIEPFSEEMHYVAL